MQNKHFVETKTNWDRTNRRVLTELIKIYKSEPCVWNKCHPAYRDRTLKDAAYQRLSAKLSEIDPEAAGPGGRERVVKKINSLRTNYRKQMKKIAEGKANGKHVPRLWYYHLLTFLDGAETEDNLYDTKYSEEHLENFDEDDFDSKMLLEDENELEESNFEPAQQESHELEIDQTTIIESKLNLHNPLEVPSPSRKVFGKRPRSNAPSDTDDDDDDDDDDECILKLPRKSLAANVSSSEDRFDIFGRMISMKLRAVNNVHQRILAEKAINDAIFMAELGELTLNHVSALSNLGTEVEYTNSQTKGKEDKKWEYVSSAPEGNISNVKGVKKKTPLQSRFKLDLKSRNQ